MRHSLKMKWNRIMAIFVASLSLHRSCGKTALLPVDSAETGVLSSALEVMGEIRVYFVINWTVRLSCIEAGIKATQLEGASVLGLRLGGRLIGCP